MFFCHFLKKIIILSKIWYQKWILWLIFIPEMYTFIYISVIIWKLQHSISFKKIWVHTPVNVNYFACLLPFCIFRLLGIDGQTSWLICARPVVSCSLCELPCVTSSPVPICFALILCCLCFVTCLETLVMGALKELSYYYFHFYYVLVYFGLLCMGYVYGSLYLRVSCNLTILLFTSSSQ